MPSSSSSSRSPVKVAFARSEAEAEMIQGLLSEHGIPSMRGLDVPEFLAAGPSDIFVPEAVAGRAREVLAGTPGGSPQGPGAGI